MTWFNGGRIKVRGGVIIMLIITQVLLTYTCGLARAPPSLTALTRLSCGSFFFFFLAISHGIGY